jgi:hypothetical protein
VPGIEIHVIDLLTGRLLAIDQALAALGQRHDQSGFAHAFSTSA